MTQYSALATKFGGPAKFTGSLDPYSRGNGTLSVGDGGGMPPHLVKHGQDTGALTSLKVGGTTYDMTPYQKWIPYFVTHTHTSIYTHIKNNILFFSPF